jgi:hypothetical protein
MHLGRLCDGLITPNGGAAPQVAAATHGLHVERLAVVAVLPISSLRPTVNTDVGVCRSDVASANGGAQDMGGGPSHLGHRQVAWLATPRQMVPTMRASALNAVAVAAHGSSRFDGGVSKQIAREALNLPVGGIALPVLDA